VPLLPDDIAHAMYSQGLLGRARRLMGSAMRQPVTMNVPYQGTQATMGDVTRMGLEMSPILGDMKAVEDAGRYWDQGQRAMAMLSGATAIPGIGDVAALGKAGMSMAPAALGSIRAYHGTPNEVFYRAPSGNIIGGLDSGSYYAVSPEYAGRYARGDGGNIIPVDIDDSNIIDTRTKDGKNLWDEFLTRYKESPEEYRPKLGKSGLPDHIDEEKFTNWYAEKFGDLPPVILVDENNGEIAVKAYDASRVKSVFE